MRKYFLANVLLLASCEGVNHLTSSEQVTYNNAKYYFSTTQSEDKLTASLDPTHNSYDAIVHPDIEKSAMIDMLKKDYVVPMPFSQDTVDYFNKYTQEAVSKLCTSHQAKLVKGPIVNDNQISHNEVDHRPTNFVPAAIRYYYDCQ